MNGGKPAAVSRRLKFAVAALATGAALAALALVFLAFAGYLALLGRLAPWQAALAVAGGAILIAALLVALASRSLGRTFDQVEHAVKTNALAVIAPTALRLLARNARLAASFAALAGAMIALWRALKPKAEKLD